MNNRQKLPQENICQKIRVLYPNAKFSVRPFENNSHLAVNPVVIGSYLVDWDNSNDSECPSLDQLNGISDNQVNDFELLEKKKVRDSEKVNDLSIIACFEVEKKSNPNLEFSAYLDSLEVKSKQEKDKMEGK